MNYYKRVDDLIARALKGEDVQFLLGQLGIVLDHLPLKTDITAPIKRKFKSEVDGKVLYKRHDIDGYIIAALYFLLRDEKDNRIHYAKRLTDMRREETKDTVLRRFEGWASSIPVNRKISNKQEILNFIVKPIKDLPKHEKTIVADQTRKLVANMDAIVADRAGAIGYYWHSLFRVPGYNYREEHKHLDLDGKFIIFKDSWAYRDGLVKRGGQIFQDDIESPGELPNCKCKAKYVYDLGSIPKDCLTIKGLEYKNDK